MSSTGVRIVDYSDKSVAVIGDTRQFKDNLKSMGGKWNAHLTVDGARAMGWIFRTSQRAAIEKLFSTSPGPSNASHALAAHDDSAPAVPPAAVAAVESLVADTPASAVRVESAVVQGTRLAVDASAVAATEESHTATATDQPATGDALGSAAEMPGAHISSDVAAACHGLVRAAPSSDEALAKTVAIGSSGRLKATLRVVDSTLLIGGNTFPLRTHWRELGGEWRPAEKVWALPAAA